MLASFHSHHTLPNAIRLERSLGGWAEEAWLVPHAIGREQLLVQPGKAVEEVFVPINRQAISEQ